MSIERLNHLRFPPETALPTLTSKAAATLPGQVAGDDTGAAKSAGAGLNPPRLTVKVPTLSDSIAPPQASVVVTIQSDKDVKGPAVAAAVYGDPRKTVVPAEAADTPDTPDTTVALQPDFVSVAVSAMREYSDEVDRQKRYAQTALAAQKMAQPVSPPSIETTSSATAAANPISAPLRGLQQLASRFNLFA